METNDGISRLHSADGPIVLHALLEQPLKCLGDKFFQAFPASFHKQRIIMWWKYIQEFEQPNRLHIQVGIRDESIRGRGVVSKGINFFIMLISYHDIILWGTPLVTQAAQFLV